MSKKLIFSLALSGLVLTATAQTTIAPAIPRDEKIEQQIETLLKKMCIRDRSYTAFDYAVENAKMDADRCELKVSVKNIGKVAGREAVQLLSLIHI